MKARLTRFLSLSVIGIVTLVISRASQGQNLITDGGFENGTMAPNPNPTGVPGWALFEGAGEQLDLNAHGGLFDLQMVGAGGYNVPGAYQVFAATPGQTYTLSGWVYTPNQLVDKSNDFAILQIAFDG